MSRKNFGAKPLTYPQPVFIIATYDENGNADAMNAAWGGISEGDELSLCLSAGHKTVKNLLKTGAFTVSMADAKHVAECDYVGIVSANTVPDKLSKAGFTTTKSENVNAPVINELVDEATLTDGKVDVAKVAPITFDPFNNEYYVLGEKVGNAFSDGKAIK